MKSFFLGVCRCRTDLHTQVSMLSMMEYCFSVERGRMLAGSAKTFVAQEAAAGFPGFALTTFVLLLCLFLINYAVDVFLQIRHYAYNRCFFKCNVVWESLKLTPRRNRTSLACFSLLTLTKAADTSGSPNTFLHRLNLSLNLFYQSDTMKVKNGLTEQLHY